MAKYDITFSCGHTENRDLIGKVKDRERKIEYFENHGLCTECWEAEKKRQFEEQNQKATEEAREYGLPDLTGSEKQVPWATTLRQKFIADTEKYIGTREEKLAGGLFTADPTGQAQLETILRGMRAAVEEKLLTETSARYWIDSRTIDDNEWLRAMGEKALTVPPAVPREVEQAALEEMTIRPTETTTSLVAEIRIEDNVVIARYPEKDDTFREIVKSVKLTWDNGQWTRRTLIKSGSTLDRATELGVKLLAAGFPIRVQPEELQAKILKAEYEPETSRWILQCAEAKTNRSCFMVQWNREDGDYYDRAKQLPGAKWVSSKGMQVPPEAFREVQDFADRYQFRLSDGANLIIKDAQAAYEAAMVADVSVPESKALPGTGRPKLTADQVDGEIDENLRDDN